MYFVDREKIEQTLAYMDFLLQEAEGLYVNSVMEKLGLERITQMVAEAILDVGNMMIDGFIMRDPGGFDDIIDILIDEKVLPKEDEAVYKEMIQLRKMVVKDYLTIDHQNLSTTILDNKDVLDQFSTHVRYYLDNELGVANAFSNE
ncbi:DUF86 domain-containing protein [Virgibacillus dakarensis]|uniref:DUF86 domain-containing protein n=1 Tax=Lentibacillus populi TaxID=1827502 RepID=A0A9W5TW97_9BACI|nr:MULTISPECIES: DUF86 domain-containing protein [Bacillaceae]MBT2217097.1 DUF86 domain-containing protein [Virgibacillus dakarensis]MTW84693.1 DUF86 domain-containing protein [Virgibacillus dakarensis]GGB36575.1 hypothetical protein GCM10011409_12500 [Lentibacillus populi]